MGNTVDKGAKMKFDNFIKNNNLNKYVTVEGFIKDTTPYYYENDLLICTSFVEGLPLSDCRKYKY